MRLAERKVQVGIVRRWDGNAAINGASAPVGLQTQGRFDCRLTTEVGSPGSAEIADPADVSVGVDRDSLADAPTGHVGTDGDNPPRRFVSEDAVTKVDLR